MGKFKPGQSKPSGSGRQKGTPNKVTSDFVAALEAAGFDLPGQLLALLPKLSVDRRADVMLELMAYVFPKRKAVEIKAIVPPEPPSRMPNAEVEALIDRTMNPLLAKMSMAEIQKRRILGTPKGFRKSRLGVQTEDDPE